MDKAKEALWTKSFVLDTLINFLVFLIYYLLIVIIAVVAKDNLHATASQAGLAVGIYIIGTVVARLLAGRFISISRVSQDALFRVIDLLDFNSYVFLHT